jgi:hypothetical protein
MLVLFWWFAFEYELRFLTSDELTLEDYSIWHEDKQNKQILGPISSQAMRLFLCKHAELGLRINYLIYVFRLEVIISFWANKFYGLCDCFIIIHHI